MKPKVKGMIVGGRGIFAEADLTSGRRVAIVSAPLAKWICVAVRVCLYVVVRLVDFVAREPFSPRRRFGQTITESLKSPPVCRVLWGLFADGGERNFLNGDSQRRNLLSAMESRKENDARMRTPLS